MWKWVSRWKGDYTSFGTIRWILITQIPTFAGLIFAVLVLRKPFVPSLSTQYYVYSSVFQGLSALVAVTLAIVVYVNERLEKAMTVHLADARNSYAQLMAGDASQCSWPLLRDMTKLWFVTTLEPMAMSLDRDLALFRGQSAKAPVTGRSSKMMTLNDSYRRLSSNMNLVNSYDDVASSLGRYEVSRKNKDNLPRAAGLGFVWSIATVMTSILFLASVDYSRGVASTGLILVTYGAVASVFYMFLMLRTLFRAYFGGGRIPGFNETGLTDSNKTKKLLSEAGHSLAHSSDFYAQRVDE
jgi:hypothetical protein